MVCVGKNLPIYFLSPKIGFLLIKPTVAHSVKNFVLEGKKVSSPLSQKPYHQLDASHPFPHTEFKYILILSFPQGLHSLLSGVKAVCKTVEPHIPLGDDPSFLDGTGD